MVAICTAISSAVATTANPGRGGAVHFLTAAQLPHHLHVFLFPYSFGLSRFRILGPSRALRPIGILIVSPQFSDVLGGFSHIPRFFALDLPFAATLEKWCADSFGGPGREWPATCHCGGCSHRANARSLLEMPKVCSETKNGCLGSAWGLQCLGPASARAY
jgi:hypothetical protein